MGPRGPKAAMPCAGPPEGRGQRGVKAGSAPCERRPAAASRSVRPRARRLEAGRRARGGSGRPEALLRAHPRAPRTPPAGRRTAPLDSRPGRPGPISSASVVDDSPIRGGSGARRRGRGWMRATDTSLAPPGRLDLSALRERERALDKIQLSSDGLRRNGGDAVSDAESRGGIGVGIERGSPRMGRARAQESQEVKIGA